MTTLRNKDVVPNLFRLSLTWIDPRIIIMPTAGTRRTVGWHPKRPSSRRTHETQLHERSVSVAPRQKASEVYDPIPSFEKNHRYRIIPLEKFIAEQETNRSLLGVRSVAVGDQKSLSLFLSFSHRFFLH